jgi:hypothetical protein
MNLFQIEDFRFQIGLWFLAFGLALELGVHTTKGQRPKTKDQSEI